MEVTGERYRHNGEARTDRMRSGEAGTRDRRHIEVGREGDRHIVEERKGGYGHDGARNMS